MPLHPQSHALACAAAGTAALGEAGKWEEADGGNCGPVRPFQDESRCRKDSAKQEYRMSIARQTL